MRSRKFTLLSKDSGFIYDGHIIHPNNKKEEVFIFYKMDQYLGRQVVYSYYDQNELKQDVIQWDETQELNQSNINRAKQLIQNKLDQENREKQLNQNKLDQKNKLLSKNKIVEKKELPKVEIVEKEKSREVESVEVVEVEDMESEKVEIIKNESKENKKIIQISPSNLVGKGSLEQRLLQAMLKGNAHRKYFPQGKYRVILDNKIYEIELAESLLWRARKKNRQGDRWEIFDENAPLAKTAADIFRSKGVLNINNGQLEFKSKPNSRLIKRERLVGIDSTDAFFIEHKNRIVSEGKISEKMSYLSFKPQTFETIENSEEKLVIYAFSVMNLIKGKNLSDILKEIHNTPNKWPHEQRMLLTCNLLSALNKLHSPPNKIIHRDIKPDNIIIGKDDLSVTFIDYGISSHHAEVPIDALGTLGYASPEALNKHSKISVDERSDLFSMARIIGQIFNAEPQVQMIIDEEKDNILFSDTNKEEIIIDEINEKEDSILPDTNKQGKEIDEKNGDNIIFDKDKKMDNRFSDKNKFETLQETEEYDFNGLFKNLEQHPSHEIIRVMLNKMNSANKDDRPTVSDTLEIFNILKENNLNDTQAELFYNFITSPNCDWTKPSNIGMAALHYVQNVKSDIDDKQNKDVKSDIGDKQDQVITNTLGDKQDQVITNTQPIATAPYLKTAKKTADKKQQLLEILNAAKARSEFSIKHDNKTSLKSFFYSFGKNITLSKKKVVALTRLIKQLETTVFDDKKLASFVDELLNGKDNINLRESRGVLKSTLVKDLEYFQTYSQHNDNKYLKYYIHK